MTDERITAVKNGDRSTFEELLMSYEPLILSEASRILSRAPEFSGEADELRQEGRLALYDAAMGYKENDGVTFGLYAKICVHNRLVSYLRKLISKRRRAERAATLVAQGGVVSSASAADELLSAYERSGEIKRIVDLEATELERAVLMLYMQKKSYAEIAEAIGRDTKSVDNAISRVKSKIKRHFK